MLGFGLVFAVLPWAWSEMLPAEKMNEFLSGALLLIAGIAALVAVLWVWYKLDQAFEAPGVRSGSVFAAIAIFVAAWICFAIGNGIAQEGIGVVITLMVAAFFLALIVFTYTRPAFPRGGCTKRRALSRSRLRARYRASPQSRRRFRPGSRRSRRS